MSNNKPSIPKGTRDFGPEQVAKRNFIISTIRTVFEKFGFMPLETPAMENLSVLTGKYGDEGDKLLFRILNSGDFLSKTEAGDYEAGSPALSKKIAEKGFRYDLTVPFARYVVMNRNDITFPFKRYQIQPVWRADRPQKGRYREFYQCDADVIGSDSLLSEAEIILMIQEVLGNLGIEDYSIKINNRKVLEGVAEKYGVKDKFMDLTVAIDKLDKIGIEGVIKELEERGIPKDVAAFISSFENPGPNGPIEYAKSELKEGVGAEGVKEIAEVFDMARRMQADESKVKFEPTLARGLSYYTGCIFEVIVNNVSIGSISGGGRYDNLTESFGLPDVSGVGFSFGLDRIYDVMTELELFPKEVATSSQVLIIPFDQEDLNYALPLLERLRAANIKSELYPDLVKMKKSMTYANNKNIPYVIVIGSTERESGQLAFKDMASGEQESLSIEQIVERLK